MKYPKPRPLAVNDELEGFDSGESELDEWLKRRAKSNHESGASRTFVTTAASGSVVGFYCLSTAAVANKSAPGKVRRQQPDPIPVILIGRLAVSTKAQGQGLGSQLLRDAMTRCVLAAESVGVRAILIHALHEEAKRFYLHFEFEPSPTDELHLFMLLKDARAAME